MSNRGANKIDPAAKAAARDELLKQIAEEGRQVANLLVEHKVRRDTVARVYRKQPYRQVFEKMPPDAPKKLKMWRLDLHQPLFLAEDGGVYRRYLDGWRERYALAELWRRPTADGVRRILVAIRDLQLEC